MTQKIILKTSHVPGKVPGNTDLDYGELAVNTYDGKLYLKKSDGTENVVEIGGRLFEDENGGVVDLTPLSSRVTALETTGTILNSRMDTLESVMAEMTQKMDKIDFDPLQYNGLGVPSVENPNMTDPAQSGNVQGLQDTINHLFTFANSAVNSIVEKVGEVGLPVGDIKSTDDLIKVLDLIDTFGIRVNAKADFYSVPKYTTADIDFDYVEYKTGKKISLTDNGGKSTVEMVNDVDFDYIDMDSESIVEKNNVSDYKPRGNNAVSSARWGLWTDDYE